ncbi:MAG: polysaccharide biosynthesis/export family protein [bacterium]
MMNGPSFQNMTRRQRKSHAGLFAVPFCLCVCFALALGAVMFSCTALAEEPNRTHGEEEPSRRGSEEEPFRVGIGEEPYRLGGDEEPYRIGVEDELFISAWDNEQLTRTVIVRPDGKISYPLLGDLQAEGLTPEEMAQSIQKGLSSFINQPTVAVTVTNINSLKVYVFGQVQKPGMVTLKRRTTILQLLSLIGGVLDTADLTKASLIRNDRMVDVNFSRLLKEGDLSQNIELQKDDTIFIPDNFDKRITIVGEVKNPKVIHFRKELTVIDAILEAGGFTEYARTDRVKISRHMGNYKKTIEVDFKAMLKKARSEMNIPLMPGDTIFVSESLL